MKIIFVDMDEILSDFIGGACKIHNFPIKELEARRTPGIWDITKPMGLATPEFWHPINKMGEEFWKSLKVCPYAFEVLRLVENYCDEFFILTAPSDHPGCYSGKIAWAQKHLPPKYCRKVIMTEHKWLLSGKDRLLIDDRHENLFKFEYKNNSCTELRGGMGLLFPHRGNCLHSLSNDPISYLKVNLNEFRIQKRQRRIPKLDELLIGKH